MSKLVNNLILKQQFFLSTVSTTGKFSLSYSFKTRLPKKSYNKTFTKKYALFSQLLFFGLVKNEYNRFTHIEMFQKGNIRY